MGQIEGPDQWAAKKSDDELLDYLEQHAYTMVALPSAALRELVKRAREALRELAEAEAQLHAAEQDGMDRDLCS